MGSPPQGPSTPAEQSSPKQSKRPSSLGRHSSSWVNRLHRHHDRKHHRSENDVERPLLANDHLDEEDENIQNQSASRSRPVEGFRRFFIATNHHTRKAYNVSRIAVVRNAKHILIACLLALLTLLISICLGFLFHYKDHKKLSTCQSTECVHAASEILYNLDPHHAQLDACTQFDKMVCGGWEQRHDLRPDQGDMFTGTIMAEKSKTILRHILEQSSSSLHSSSADQDNFQKLKDDYDSCMNEGLLQEIGLKPLQAIVDQIRTSLPTTVDRTRQSVYPLETTQKRFNPDGTNQLTDTLLYCMKLGIRTFLTFNVEVSIVSRPLSTINLCITMLHVFRPR